MEHGATFSLLFDKRQAGDYNDFAYCDLAMVDMLRPRAEDFIRDVARLTRGEAGDVSRER